jgi:hypothetical protein
MQINRPAILNIFSERAVWFWFAFGSAYATTVFVSGAVSAVMTAFFGAPPINAFEEYVVPLAYGVGAGVLALVCGHFVDRSARPTHFDFYWKSFLSAQIGMLFLQLPYASSVSIAEFANHVGVGALLWAAGILLIGTAKLTVHAVDRMRTPTSSLPTNC